MGFTETLLMLIIGVTNSFFWLWIYSPIGSTMNFLKKEFYTVKHKFFNIEDFKFTMSQVFLIEFVIFLVIYLAVILFSLYLSSK